jgi:hypothetical protein
MSENLLTYVNSTMDEVHSLTSDLYESMVDNDRETLIETIKSLRKVLSDIQKSYYDEGN